MSAIGVAGCGLVASVGPVRVTVTCLPSIHALPVDFGVDVRGGIYLFIGYIETNLFNSRI